MNVFTVFDRHKNSYGSFGIPLCILRIVVLVTGLILLGSTAAGVAATNPAKSKFDPVEVFGVVLGSLVALHSVLGLFPGTKVTPVQRLFEAGAVLTFMLVLFVAGVLLTPKQLPTKYTPPGPTKGARMWTALVAACISAVALLAATALDFLRRKGYSATSAVLDQYQV